MDGVSWIVIDLGRHFDTKAVYTYSLTNSQESFVSNELKNNFYFAEDFQNLNSFDEVESQLDTVSSL